MNGLVKFLIIFFGGIGFYIITGDGSEAILLITILSYLEFRSREE